MDNLPSCPKCNSEYTYEDENLLICPECGNEWISESKDKNSIDTNIIKDANGNVLSDGDSVTIIKDLKLKGSTSVIKRGTKVKNIRLIHDPADGEHDIDCKVDGFGAMFLKSTVIKKI